MQAVPAQEGTAEDLMISLQCTVQEVHMLKQRACRDVRKATVKAAQGVPMQAAPAQKATAEDPIFSLHCTAQEAHMLKQRACRDVRKATVEAAKGVPMQAAPAQEATAEDLMFSMSYGTNSELSEGGALAASLAHQLDQEQVSC